MVHPPGFSHPVGLEPPCRVERLSPRTGFHFLVCRTQHGVAPEAVRSQENNGNFGATFTAADHKPGKVEVGSRRVCSMHD